MTQKLFLENSYLNSTQTVIKAIVDKGIILEATNFYARSGGQPGDKGVLKTSSSGDIEIIESVYSEDRSNIIHIPVEGADLSGLKVGDIVTTELEWEHRYNIMKMHSCLHLLSVVLPYPVTGGQMNAQEGRLDFDLPEMPKDKIALSEDLNALINGKYDITQEWITDEELDAKPDLVKTMSVKPPRGSGYIRLIRIGDIDLQPCGGTHVKNTSEIGKVEISKVEKKGKQNRRVRIRFVA